MKIRYLFFSLAVLSGAQISRATLEFDRTTISLNADAGTQVLHAKFKFTNNSSSSLKIVEVKPACGCTTTGLAKDTYESGETGELPVVFHVGAMVGRNVKTIDLVTDEAQKNRHTLTLDVTIAELFTITPRFLFWRPDEALTAKELIVTFAIDKDVKFAGMQDPAGLFRAEVRESDQKGKFAIAVTPVTENTGIRSELEIDFEQGFEKRIQRKVFLRVLPSGAAIDPLRTSSDKVTK